jgi:hypothetical protein
VKYLILSFKLSSCSLGLSATSHQPAVLFSHNKPATNNQPTVLFSQNKPAPAISHQPNEQADGLLSRYPHTPTTTQQDFNLFDWYHDFLKASLLERTNDTM